MNNKLDTLLKENSKGYRYLAKGVTVTNDGYESGLNNNDLIIGGSGSGKTTGYVCVNLNNPTGSMVVSDTKGNLYRKYADGLRKKGYDVKVLDFVNPEASVPYNPLAFIQKESDIKKIALNIVPQNLDNTALYWTRAAARYISALIGYVLDALPEEEHHMMSVVKLHQAFMLGPGKIIMEKWAAENPDSYASRKFKMIKGTQSADKTWGCILEFANEALDIFDCKEYFNIFGNRETIDLREIGRKKTVIFINSSDNDMSMDSIVNLFNIQLIQVLIEEADKNQNGRLICPTRIIMDDFASSAKIENFDKLISVIRSRDISVSLMLQSISQIKSMYDENDAMTIINNCDHILYLGGSNDLESAVFIAEHINKTCNTVMNLESDKAILITRGKPCEIIDKIKPMDNETGLNVGNRV